MTARYPILYRSIQLIALLLVLVGAFFPGKISNIELLLALPLILLIGIPHGATDHLIFKDLTKPFLGTRRMNRFFVNYVLMMGLYGVVWLIFPMLALALFLLLSAYHFGQSNWNYVAFKSFFWQQLNFFSWGIFVLAMPILIHIEESAPIIYEITGVTLPAISYGVTWWICGSLFLLNIGLIIYSWLDQRIDNKAFRDELINLCTLSLLFVFTPLLVGFAIYFALWHSLSSVMDQIAFFRQKKARFNLVNYLQKSLPMSVLAISSIVAVFFFFQEIQLGWMFIFISMVTLPHMVLIDRLYEDLDMDIALFNSIKHSIKT